MDNDHIFACASFPWEIRLKTSFPFFFNNCCSQCLRDGYTGFHFFGLYNIKINNMGQLPFIQ